MVRQVQALRAVEHHLNLDKLYVLGTNCVDNGPRQGLDKFLKAASSQPETVTGYEFMQVCSFAPCQFLLARLLQYGPVRSSIKPVAMSRKLAAD